MASPERDFLRAGGRRLEFLRHGRDPAQHPTLVFLHEGLGCAGLWGDFPERLADATGWAALVYSRAGYGASDPCDLPRPIRYMHDEALRVLPEVLRRAGVRDHVLVGHSDGGSIALVYAGSERRPGLRGLVTEAAHVFNEEVCVEAVRGIVSRYENGDLRARLERHHAANTECAFRGWSGVWLDPRFAEWNLEEYLPGVAVPWLVIQGALDTYGTLAQVDAIERGAGGDTERWIVPDCGHSPHRECAEAALERMVRFVRARKGEPMR